MIQQMKYKQLKLPCGRVVVEESGRDCTDVLFLYEVYMCGGKIEGVGRGYWKEENG